MTVNPGTAEENHLPTRYADYPLKEGDIFRLETPGGGGLGDPFERDPAKVLADVAQGYVSPQRAERDYGVAVVKKGRNWEIDETATARLRPPSPPRGGPPRRKAPADHRFDDSPAGASAEAGRGEGAID